jgi:diguanylate cyclase
LSTKRQENYVSQQELQLAQNAIALMSKYEVVPVPEHYEVFYIYAAGSNPAVTRRIDDAISSGEKFTPQMIHALRENCLGSERTAKAVEQVGTTIGLTLDDVLSKLLSAGKQAGDYGRALSDAKSDLTQTKSAESLHALVDGLLGATKAMQVRTKNLEGELKRSSSQVVELKRQLDVVRKESRMDALTGIANRKTFDIELENALNEWKQTGASVCLLMCDIDFFKKFNDTWGHQTGDQVLRLVASCISENVKGRDTAARYGGEEFAVILRHTRLSDAINLANQIRMTIESRKLIKKSTGEILGSITVSIGVAEALPSDNSEELVQRADVCLYRAKQTGRNRVIGQPGRGW